MAVGLVSGTRLLMDSSGMSTDGVAALTAPTFADITSASERLRGIATRTPLEPSEFLSDIAGVPVYLKLECWQRTRSFKLRGAYNAVHALDTATLARGLVTASAGNHGQAVALAARMTGAHATVFVPATAPAVKKSRIRSFGATVDETATDYDAAEAAAQVNARKTGRYFVHAFSDFNVVAGQGTVGLEIAEDLPAVRHVVVPVGGGGLATGVGIALRAIAPAATLHGVQSDETRAMYDAFQAGHLVDSPITPTLADGLAGCTDETAYAWLRAIIDHVHLVPEPAIARAMRVLFESAGVVAEGAGAVGVAAVMERMLTLDGPTVVVVSGGNVDPATIAAILNA